MATLTLTDEEVAEVSLLIGASNPLSAEQIRSNVILGTASDYVFEEIRKGMNVEALTPSERAIAERFADETEDDIANFVNVVLKPPQRSQMRRAVMYRCAGLCVPIVQQLSSESAGGISQRLTIQQWEIKQAGFFQRADEEITRLNEAFPDDAFSEEPARKLPKYTLFASTR